MSGSHPTASPIPLSGLRFEVTTRCNMKCAHCHVSAGVDGLDLDFESFRVILESAVEQGVSKVRFSGGEPGLWPHIWEAIRACRESGLAVSVNTVSPTFIEELARLGEELGGIRLTTTLNASCPGDHDRVVGIEGHYSTLLGCLKALGGSMMVDVNYPLLRSNLPTVFEARRVLEDCSVERLCLNRLYPAGRAGENRGILPGRAEMAELISSVLATRGDQISPRLSFANAIPLCIVDNPWEFHEFNGGPLCKHGRETLSISADLRPSFCVALPTESPLPEGSGIRNAFESQHARRWRDGEFLPVICQECDLVGWCRGGCRLAALDADGVLDGHDPLSRF